VIAAITRFDRRVTDGAVTIEVQRRGGDAQPLTLLDDGQHGDGLPGDGCYGGAPVVEPGEALLRLRVKRAGAERVRTTWIDARPGEARVPTCPDLRGRNGEIAFAQHNSTWATVSPEGQIGSLPLRTGLIPEASFSRDGSRLAWSQFDKVFVGNADATEPVKVAGGDEVRRADVAWSPDGKQLAYTRGCSGALTSTQLNCRLVVLDLATGTEREVTTGAAPTWSPDGESLAFVKPGSNYKWDTDIFTVRKYSARIRKVSARKIARPFQ